MVTNRNQLKCKKILAVSIEPCAANPVVTPLKQQRSNTMPVLLVPLLVGIPVLIGGGYFIVKAFN
jgi:hypothetical protein